MMLNAHRCAKRIGVRRLRPRTNTDRGPLGQRTSLICHTSSSCRMSSIAYSRFAPRT